MRNFKLKTLAAAAGLAVVLCSPARAQQALQGLEWKDPVLVVAGQGPAPASLDSLMADKISAGAPTAAESVPSIRAQGIQEAAASLGTRAGLAKGLSDLSAALERRQRVMSADFDFSKVALSVPMRVGTPATAPNPKTGNGEYAMILPPVILEGEDADSFPSDDEMRIADRVYKIHANAKLIPVDKATGHPAVPSWRDYLIFSFQEVQPVHPSLLPRTEGERAIWNQWIKRGWDEGIKQSSEMFDGGWAKLNRDFKGMLNYRLAYDQGLATRPEVAGVFMGVTGGGSEMRLNDRTVRITDHSALVPDTKKWSTLAPK